MNCLHDLSTDVFISYFIHLNLIIIYIIRKGCSVFLLVRAPSARGKIVLRLFFFRGGVGKKTGVYFLLNAAPLNVICATKGLTASESAVFQIF